MFKLEKKCPRILLSELKISLHLSVSTNNISLLFDIPNIQISLCFGVPDNPISLNFGIPDHFFFIWRATVGDMEKEKDTKTEWNLFGGDMEME